MPIASVSDLEVFARVRTLRAIAFTGRLTDLASPVRATEVVERVKKFNFGPKDGVPKITILYPIDFLPAST